MCVPTIWHTHNKREKCLSCSGRSLCLRPDATISESNQCPTGSIYLLLLLRRDLRCVRARRGGGRRWWWVLHLRTASSDSRLFPSLLSCCDRLIRAFLIQAECHKVKDTRARRAFTRGVSVRVQDTLPALLVSPSVHVPLPSEEGGTCSLH